MLHVSEIAEHMNFKESNLNYGKESEIKFAPSKKI
jgi:hypothetical protein